MRAEKYPWTLENLEITLIKIRNQDDLAIIHMNTWLKIAEGQKKKKWGNVTSVIKWNI